MIAMLQRKFALTEQGARDLVRATWLSALANLSLMFPVGLLVLVLDRLISALDGGDPAAGIWQYTGLALLLVALIFVVHLVQYKALYIATYTESANRRIGLAEKLRQLPLSFFGMRDLSDLTATLMSDCAALEQVFSHQVPQLFGSVISTVLIGIGLLCMDWRLALAALWVLPVALLMTVGTKRLQDRGSTASLLAKRAAADGLQELLETVKDIKACNRKEEYLDGLRERFAQVERAAIRSELTTGVFVTAAQSVLRLGIPAVVLTGALLMARGSLSFLVYLVFLLAVARLYDPLSIVMTQLAALFNAGVKIRRMQAMEEEPEQTGSPECRPDGYDIVFDHVKFAYNDREGVLEDVSFTARQGQVTALVGPSGGGKSTAAKLAARFWDVDGGRITLGGVDVKTVEPEALLKSYAIVFQDVVLFHDTILENIRLGRKGATDQQVLAAARAAQCDAFVQKLPDGYQTVIGENGSTLSGGERQRISIARALLKDAPVILLDEATASLDVENETAVQAALSGLVKDKTVLIIAHRMRTVAGADRVVVLEHGRVAQQGSPRELMEQGGLYRRMVELQNESADWSL
mgnify:CR=1 FL=1